MKDHNNIFKTIFTFIGVLVLIYGYAFSNILHFTLEDYLDLRPQSSFYMGKEYATSLSYLLLSGIAILVLTYFKQRLFFKDNSLKDLPWIKKTTYWIMITALIISFFHLIYVMYLYFSGKSLEEELYKALITLCVLGIGTAYVWFESTISPRLSLGSYYLVVCFTYLLSAGLSLGFTFHFASPKLLRELRKDHELFKSMSTLADSAKEYFINMHTLPHSKEEMAQKGLSVGLEQTEPTYKKIEDSLFEVCATFHYDSRKYKRNSPHLGKDFFKPGYQCQRFMVESKEGHTSLRSLKGNSIYIYLFQGNQ
jgi:hypothetical protein